MKTHILFLTLGLAVGGCISAQTSTDGCTVNPAPASVERIGASGWDLALSLGTCPATVLLTVEWHALAEDGTPLACRDHQTNDGDDGNDADEREERDDEGDGREGHRNCGIIQVNPATGLARLKNLQLGTTYSFTATAHSTPVVIADFTVNLPPGASAAQLIFVNRLASVPTRVPPGTCRVVQGIFPPEAKFLPALSNLSSLPATMSPGQSFNVRIAFANCSDRSAVPTFETWTDKGGYFLKARPTYATDLTQWGFGTVALPPNNPCFIAPCAIVPPGYMATFDFTIHAPMIPTKANPLPADLYEFIWGMRHETPAVQRWIDNPSQMVNVTVVKNPVTLISLCPLLPSPCPGIAVPPICELPELATDISGNLPAATAIQNCINRTPPGGTLELPLGIYLIDRKVTISKPITFRTAGIPTTNTDGCWSPYPTVTPCAVLQAMPEPPTTIATEPKETDPPLFGNFGFFQVWQLDAGFHDIDNVHIDHILIDGNRSARVYNPPGFGPLVGQGPTEYACKFGGVTNLNFYDGYNARIYCENCSLKFSAVINAVCGAGLSFYCENGEDGRCDNNLIEGNVIAGNGNQAERLWADGFGYNGVGGTITGNYSVDGSGVNMIFGGVAFKNTPAKLSHFRTISNNVIIQSKQHTFTGLALAQFDKPVENGSFQGDMVTGNRIDCSAGLHLCDYGIQLGNRNSLPGCSGPSQGTACTTSYFSSISRFASIPPLPAGTFIPYNPDTCSYNLYGGTVTGNTIMNAKQGMIIDGVGAAAQPLGSLNCPSGTTNYPVSYKTVVFNNTVTGSDIGAPLFMCDYSLAGIPAGDTPVPITAEINISDFYNFVDTNGTTFPSFSIHTYCTNPPAGYLQYCPVTVPPTPPQSPNSAGYFCS